MITQNPLLLLDQLSKHPRGLELAYLVYQLHQDGQMQTQPKSGLVAIALNLAKRQGIKDRPYFKGMANDEIRGWIAQHSPKPEIN
ncbi:hypothetical protein QUB63_15105 [Microcoleus sp. ARI1-B5]|uniref:hypothetical protein n=1 Tax=unclassified Microcoleus TaxID=2642155 RepID=UPI0025CB8341|nr:hypothetical protein [Microcoleus sp. CAWBG58]